MDRPKLRKLERQTLEREGETLLVIRDPLELCEPFAIDAAYAPVLDALDGLRTLAQIRQSLLMRGLASVDLDDLCEFVDELGDSGLLDDDRFRARWAAAHEAFVDTEVREPRRAGILYPDTPEGLQQWLAPALPQAPTLAVDPHRPVAVVVPHQPPPALGPTLRRLLAGLGSPEGYDHVVVLATDHSPGLLPYASTDKDWNTPLGLLRADLPILAALDERVPWLLREQIRLRTSDTVELATLLLRALWGERCPPVLPIACGQTRLTTREGRDRSDELVGALEVLLGPASAEGRVLWWTAAELSHAGPAFGHSDLPSSDAVEAIDRAMLEPLLAGQPKALARSLMDRPQAQRPSGAAALVTLAELLPIGYRAAILEHRVLPAPDAGGKPGWVGCPLLRVDRPQ